MTAYSSTPLAKKLGIRPNAPVVALGAPPHFPDLLAPLPEGVRIAKRPGPFDVALLFVTRAAGLEDGLARLTPHLERGGRLWVCWPKKSSGVRTDCRFEVVQGAGLAIGLVDTKVCAIDETWSGLCLMRRRESPEARAGREDRL